MLNDCVYQMCLVLYNCTTGSALPNYTTSYLLYTESSSDEEGEGRVFCIDTYNYTRDIERLLDCCTVTKF